MTARPAKTLLVAIGGDPHATDRPAEAIRVAAGIGAWKKVRVSVCLHGPALACLTEPSENLEAGELIAEHLPAILEHGGEIFAVKAVKSGNMKPVVVKSLPKLVAEHDALLNYGVPGQDLGIPQELASMDGAKLYDAVFPSG